MQLVNLFTNFISVREISWTTWSPTQVAQSSRSTYQCQRRYTWRLPALWCPVVKVNFCPLPSPPICGHDVVDGGDMEKRDVDMHNILHISTHIPYVAIIEYPWIPLYISRLRWVPSFCNGNYNIKGFGMAQNARLQSKNFSWGFGITKWLPRRQNPPILCLWYPTLSNIIQQCAVLYKVQHVGSPWWTKHAENITRMQTPDNAPT